jgi:hypothetical protein
VKNGITTTIESLPGHGVKPRASSAIAGIRDETLTASCSCCMKESNDDAVNMYTGRKRNMRENTEGDEGKKWVTVKKREERMGMVMVSGRTRDEEVIPGKKRNDYHHQM